MRNLGLLLVFLGIASAVVHFLGMEMRWLLWIDQWGETVAWAIRGGLVVLGLLLAAIGKPKAAAK